MQITVRSFEWKWLAITAAMALALLLVPQPILADDDDDLEERVEKLELKVAQDRVNFSGDLRVTVDNIDATLAERYDGLAFQKGMLDTFFFLTHPLNQTPGGPLIPGSSNDVNGFIGDNYGDYRYFQDTLNFDQVKQIFENFPAMMSMLPPASQDDLNTYLGGLTMATYRPEEDYSNDIMYTTRLRLNMKAKIKENVNFTGRLAMYKSWGDSTGVQVFNGSPNSFTLDGTTSSVPNSDVLHVERAFFNWKHIGGSKWYLSIGRRPSTGGPPLHVQENELRGGTVNGHVVDLQFDGITLGRPFENLLPGNQFRFCYGLGFESGWGSADQLKAPADRLDDVHFGGINWDLYYTDTTKIQTTILGAWDVTDGFNGLIVLPVDPVSGNSLPAPMVLRYSPSTNLGDIYLGSATLEREEGPLYWFVSYAYMKSDPDPVTSPFGGLFSDPFDTPEKQDGWSVYAGLRFPVGNNFFGVEYNHGSEYWFNFTQAADDLVGAKLSTRGSVYEGYWLHEFKEGFGRARMKFRLGAQFYDFEHSGSGWHTGAPKELDNDGPVPMLGFPTYSEAFDVQAALIMKF